MAFDLNPLDIVSKVWAMKYGYILAIPGLLLLGVVAFSLLYLAVHLFIRNIRADGKGLPFSEISVNQSWFGPVASVVLVATVVIWFAMVMLAAKPQPNKGTGWSAPSATTAPNIALTIGGVVYNGDAANTLLQVTVSIHIANDAKYIAEWQGVVTLNGYEYAGILLIGQHPLQGSINLPNLDTLTGEAFTGIRSGFLFFQIPVARDTFEASSETIVFLVRAIDNDGNQWATQRTYPELAAESFSHYPAN